MIIIIAIIFYGLMLDVIDLDINWIFAILSSSSDSKTISFVSFLEI